MQFSETELEGVYRIQLAPKVDSRGYFSRTFCRKELRSRGLVAHIEQCNLVRNERKGVLRGIHFHEPPLGEVKIIQCVRGSLFDVLVDLRPESATYGKWISTELRAANPVALYVPKGIGHGYQTLEDETYLTYFMSDTANPSAEQGIRWNDPGLNIDWPIRNPRLSNRDESRADFDFMQYRKKQEDFCRAAVEVGPPA
jgi:dTDP-4-dehydrorhamnose 3,5-epimerase